MAKLEDICRLTGKSRTTVSRVLRNDKRYPVRDAVRQQVLEAARQVGYVPNQLAKSLATGKSFCIGVVLAQAEKDLASPFFAPTLLEMVRVGMQHGYHLTPLPVELDGAGESRVLEMIQRRRIDGFYLGTGIAGRRTLEELSRQNIPAVTTDSSPNLADTRVINVVHRDERPGFAALANELKRRGHERVGYITPGYLTRNSAVHHRMPMLREALAEQGIDLPEERMLCYEPRTEGALADISEARWAAERNLDRFAECTAIVGANDSVAFGVADALRAQGVEPGRDVALAGFGNHEELATFPTAEPFLTTIDPSRRLRGRKIAELLIQCMEDPSLRPRTFHVSTRLIVRSSMTSVEGGCQEVNEEQDSTSL